MKTAIYIRVSTEEQAKEGFSIAAQREKLTAFVQSQDWDIYDYYIDDGASAKNLERPELQRLINDLQNRCFDIVLVYKLDRLTRSVLDLYQLLQEFERYDVKFKSATEVYDTTTAIGRLFITLVAALAQWERENLAERVKFGQEQMVNELKRPGGRPPYGFDLKDGTLVINEDEAKYVREMFERYLTGTGFDSIAIDLNQRGVRTKQGNNWDKKTIQLILQNHTYYGALRWNYAKGGRKVNSPDEWIIIDNVYDAIIDKSTFQKVQDMMNSRKLKHPRALASDFIFSGVLRCSKCGEGMYGKTAKVMNGGKLYIMRHYICKNVKIKKCDCPIVREERLEEIFLKELNGYNDIQAARTAFKKRKISPRSKDSIENQLNKLAEKRKRWQTAYAEGLIEIEELRERIAEDRQKESELKQLLQQESNDKATLSDEQIIGMIQNLQVVWSYATPSQKKHLVTVLVKSMTIDVEKTPQKTWTKNKTIKIKNLEFN